MLFVTATADGTTHFITFSLNIEGATAMALQFIMSLWPIYDKNIGFEQNYIFEHHKKAKNRNKN
jgi:hypothetical protein